MFRDILLPLHLRRLRHAIRLKIKESRILAWTIRNINNTMTTNLQVFTSVLREMLILYHCASTVFDLGGACGACEMRAWDTLAVSDITHCVVFGLKGRTPT
jgi:hypothetical protein